MAHYVVLVLLGLAMVLAPFFLEALAPAMVVLVGLGTIVLVFSTIVMVT